MAAFLAARGADLLPLVVVEHRLLLDASPAIEHGTLPGELDLDRPFDGRERVEVLDLGLGAQHIGGGAAHRNVHVDAQRPLFHVGIGDLDVLEDLLQATRVRRRLGGRADVGLGDDLHERGPGAIEVDGRRVAEAIVHRLAGVLLHVHPMHANVARRSIGVMPHGDAAVRGERPIELRDLVALGQVGVEVVLAGEHRLVVHRASQRERGAGGEGDGARVEHGQCARQAEAQRAGVRVRRFTERGRAAAEDLAAGLELAVDLEADDEFPWRRRVHRCASAPRAVSSAAATRTMVASSKCAAIS